VVPCEEVVAAAGDLPLLTRPVVGAWEEEVLARRLAGVERVEGRSLGGGRGGVSWRRPFLGGTCGVVSWGWVEVRMAVSRVERLPLLRAWACRLPRFVRREVGEPPTGPPWRSAGMFSSSLSRRLEASGYISGTGIVGAKAGIGGGGSTVVVADGSVLALPPDLGVLSQLLRLMIRPNTPTISAASSYISSVTAGSSP
jgi:hypothetical protein